MAIEIPLWVYQLSEFDPETTSLSFGETKIFRRRSLFSPTDLLVSCFRHCPVVELFFNENNLHPDRYQVRPVCGMAGEWAAPNDWFAVLYAIYENEGRGIFVKMWLADNQMDDRA